MNEDWTILGTVLGILLFIWVILIAANIFIIVCYWKVFKKAGKEGWGALIPIYNIVVLVEISGISMWYLLLLLIPGLGTAIFSIMIFVELAKKFGKGTGFALGLIFLNPIFMGILAFDKDLVYGTVQQNNNTHQQIPGGNCKRCGAPTNFGDSFCMNCGNQL